MSSNQSRVIVGVKDHWLLGALTIGNGRIQDRLNDVKTDFLTFSDIEVHSNTNCQCLARLPELVVPRCKIEFAGVPTQEHEAPQKRLLQYAKRDTCRSTVVVSHYVISGELHLPECAGDSALHAFTQQLAGFFPITDATLVSSATGESVHFPVAFANKEFVTGFHLDREFSQADGADVFDRLSKLLANTESDS